MSDDSIVEIDANEMTYNGNHVFHYTSLDSALKIVISNSLKFGSFNNMNDIAEVRRELYDNVDSKTLSRFVSEYQAICLTDDSKECRGFAIDALWGYYADKGNGVCLVFDKSELFKEYNTKYSCNGVPIDLKISYIEDCTNAVFANGETHNEVLCSVENNIANIFYTKDVCWSHENEIRLLTKFPDEVYLDIGESLIGVIICVPTAHNYKDTNQFKLLSALQTNRNFKIYHYTTSLGNKELRMDEIVKWPVMGVDMILEL